MIILGIVAAVVAAIVSAWLIYRAGYRNGYAAMGAVHEQYCERNKAVLAGLQAVSALPTASFPRPHSHEPPRV